MRPWRTSFTFLCREDFLKITDGKDKIFGLYCGNKTGQTLHVTGDEVKILFYSNEKIEERGYLLNFTLIPPATVPRGKWDHKETDRTYKVHQVYLPLKYPVITKIHFHEKKWTRTWFFRPFEKGFYGQRSVTLGALQSWQTMKLVALLWLIQNYFFHDVEPTTAAI